MRRFVSYCMSRVQVLRAAGVTPVIVFDGGKLPMKANEEEGRSRLKPDHCFSILAPVSGLLPACCPDMHGYLFSFPAAVTLLLRCARCR